MLLSLVLLNLACGDCVEDIRKVEADDGFCEVLKKAEMHKLKRKVHRALLRRWRKEKTRSVPPPSAIFRYLGKFHDKGQEKYRQPGKAFIPASNEHLRGLVGINKDLAAFANLQGSENAATLDMDATSEEAHAVMKEDLAGGRLPSLDLLIEARKKILLLRPVPSG